MGAATNHLFTGLDLMFGLIEGIFFNRANIQYASFVTITRSGNTHHTKRLSLDVIKIKTFYGSSIFPTLKG